MPAQWMCDACHKFFQRKGDLKRHEKLHTGEKPHVCDDCGKAFAQFTGLKTHRNVHTGAKPHECNVCGARFGDPSSCARHKRETHMHPEGYQCFVAGCRTKIKRRSAFVKHVKAKHDIDLTKMTVEEAAAAADLIRVSSDDERITTPPPDYTTATKEPMYQEEDLPTFSSDGPKEEVQTPPSVVTPPPAVIEVIPSSGGHKWTSAGFVDHAPLDAGVVCGSPDPALLVDLQQHHSEIPMLGVNCFFYPEIPQQPPSYYEQQWSATPTTTFASSPIPVDAVAQVDIFNSSPSPCAPGTDYNLTYDPNACGDFDHQISSLMDAADMHAYMTPVSMPSLSAFSFA